MRIAAYCAGYEPEAGGGYTFESEVLEALLLVAGGKSGMDFVLLCPEANAKALGAHVAGSALAVRAVPASFADRFLQPFLRESAFVRAHWRRPSAIDRAAAAAGADLVWFLGVGVHYTNLPYVTVVWDLQHRATPWFPEMSANGVWDGRELAHDWFLKRASSVIVGTEVGRNEVRDYYAVSPSRIALLPHPTPRFALDAGPASPVAQDIAHLRIKRPYFLYPAQFWAHKNHVNLILALAELVSRHRLDVELAFVGSDKGNRDHVWAAAREAGVADRLNYLGFVSRDDLIRLYRNAIALAYASWCGPENLPPLEAFALGCPVVATRIPGAEEQLGGAALFVDPASPADIADGLACVHSDAAVRAELVAKGLARARRWTAREYVSGAMDIFAGLEPVLRCWRADRA
jgi:glycosyltransferase involved in cell wall biosynthesis